MPEARVLTPPTLDDIREAGKRIQGAAVRTPLIPLHGVDADIWLKLENLQPAGCFKSRGAGNAMRRIPEAELHDGVTTASAGNMAQAVAWNARRVGVPCRVIVPDHAPRTKLAAVERHGGQVVKVPFDEWWQVILDHGHPDVPGRFIHPVSSPDVIAGNGTIGLEIVEDLPDVDAVVVPYGGGGLSAGIAVAMRALRPEAKVFAAEVATAAPLHASLAAGKPVAVEYTPSFVDGIGGKSVLEEMWPVVSSRLDGSLVVPLEEVARALRLLLERNRVIAEGAGAASVAAALSGAAGRGRTVCVVSGGNIDFDRLIEVVRG